jgi:hypothetical protein
MYGRTAVTAYCAILLLLLSPLASAWISPPEEGGSSSYSVISDALINYQNIQEFLLRPDEVPKAWEIKETRAMSVDELTNGTGLVPGDFENAHLAGVYVQKFSSPYGNLSAMLMVFGNHSDASKFFSYYKGVHRFLRTYDGKLNYGYAGYSMMGGGIVFKIENGVFTIIGDNSTTFANKIQDKTNDILSGRLKSNAFHSLLNLSWLFLVFLVSIAFLGTKSDKSKQADSPDFRINLLDFQPIRDILFSGTIRYAIKIAMLLLLALLLVSGLFLSQNQRTNFATFAWWAIWFPLVYFTCLFFGRIWCNVCPIGFTGDLASRFSRKKRYPSKLRNLWIAVPLFAVLVVSNLFLNMIGSPANTAYLLLVLVIAVVLVNIIFEKRAFCRFLCPVGPILGVYAMLSITELRCSDRNMCKDKRCAECVEACAFFEVPNLREKSNYCDFCTECAKKCPHDNIKLNLRFPGKEPARLKKAFADESLLISILLGLGFPLILQNTAFFKGSLYLISKSLFLDAQTVMVLLLLLSMLISAALIYLPFLILRKGRASILFAYSLIPLTLMATLAYNLTLLKPTALSLVGSGLAIELPLAGMLNIVLPLASVFAAFVMPIASNLYLIQIAFLFLGYFISLYVARGNFSRKAMFLIFLFAAGYLFAMSVQ